MIRLKGNQDGFTIIEMIVVIIVIGVLLLVSVFSFSQWRSMAANKEVRSDLNGVAAAMDSARTWNNGYPLSIPTSFVASQNVTLTYKSGDATTYCIDAVSKVVPAVKFFVNAANGNKTPVAGTCP